MSVFYDEAGAIGRRYRRQDEAGTPFGITVDFDTLGEQGPALLDTVTLRDRDTMKQERVKIGDLLPMRSEERRGGKVTGVQTCALPIWLTSIRSASKDRRCWTP